MVKRISNAGRGKRFTFQSTVRQLERRRIADKLSKEADLKEQQRRTELEAMRRVEEEFQRKRAREKANIRQQLRLVSSGATSMPTGTHHSKGRDEPDGSCRESPAPERTRDGRQRHSNTSSEISGRSKSSTPIRCVEVSDWRTGEAPRVYRDWAAGLSSSHAHPPACARMPIPRSDNYRLEFARGRSPRSPRTPRPPRLLSATRSPSTSGSELSLRQPIKISNVNKESTIEEPEESTIGMVPIVRPAPSRAALAAV
ncbi:putative mutS-like protein 5 isoform c [Operophtera brumata]|uniref:Putative mutS-like protein 5 isoform c n=1 Tax=Operophtera brumata TaxID=104452 RepID=A0A0L7KSK8_OPEBR|nr:putative mutS-like protein 5 isoform c [Operophtera brumata]